MAAINSLAYLIYSILTLTTNNKPTTDHSLSAWEVGSDSQFTDTWNQENYVTRNYIWPDSDASTTRLERCEQPAAKGACFGHFPRYYFDQDAGECKKFVYGGCGGNENNFKTKEGCRQACGNDAAWRVNSEYQTTETWNQEQYITSNYDAEKCPPGEEWSECDAGCEITCETVGQDPQICPRMCVPGCVCSRPGEVRGPKKQCIAPPLCPKKEEKTCDDKPETGMCRGRFPMWYYDDSSSDCKKFIYGGCGGNGNRYKTKGECLKNCANIWPDSDVSTTGLEQCEHPAEPGLCHGHFPRFYFDKEAGQCKKFVYGGCGGNENNFKTEEECQQTCGKHARRS